MKILNPDNSTHTIVVQPRFDPVASLTFNLTNEVDNTENTILNTYTYISKVLSMTFDVDVLEGDRYAIEIKEGAKVIYRGKAFATSQTPQDYKLTEGKYIYAE